MSRPGRWPWWVQVLAVHATARGLSAVVFVLVAGTQAASGWTDASPSYPQYTGLMWDASWYRAIAEHGYPSTLPRGDGGAVLQNSWAFYPLFPLLTRPLLAAGLPWEVAAPTLAVVLSGLAMLVVHRVLTHAMAQPAAGDLPGRVRRAVPLTGVALLATAASAPVLQTAYTEALALLLLASALWALQRERYLLAAAPVLALGLTRAVALPLVVAVLAHGVARWRRDGATRWPALAALAAATVASGLAWPAVAGAVTGEPTAFTATQSAWRGRAAVVPVLPWFDVSRWLLGDVGPVAVVLLVAIAVGLLAARPVRRLGAELWGWTAGYLGYLFVAVEPGTSLGRFALLAFPVVGALAQQALGSRHPRAAVGALVVLGVVGQVAWIGLVWGLVPPAGWPP